MASTLENMIVRRFGGRDLPIALVLPDGNRLPLSSSPEVDVTARSWGGLRALASPSMGQLARAYVHGEIDFSGSARRILKIAESMVENPDENREGLVARGRAFLNQRRSNKSNVQYHYDVSNTFYRMWLDAQMVYSCAYFRTDDDSLELAQAQKLDHICRKLRLQKGERFLDIGCGWGGLIFRAAERYGVEATGITLSRNQFEHVQAEIARRGLGGRVKVQLLDYLDLPDDVTYQKIASVGMFEHVGVARFPRYFGKIRRILAPGGLVLNHGITHNWPGVRSLGSGIGDFVEQYVFPGGELAHVSKLIAALAEEGLELLDAEPLRVHYANTLWHWTERLEANAAAARTEVGEERFRIWRIYLAGSAHAFDRGWLNLFQLLAGRPHADGRLPHPLTREFMYG